MRLFHSKKTILRFFFSNFPPLFILWKENDSLNAMRFFYVLSNCPGRMKTFYLQIIANLHLNATEILGFLKYVRSLGFLKKKDGFLKTNMKIFKSGKRCKTSVKCVVNDIIP